MRSWYLASALVLLTSACSVDVPDVDGNIVFNCNDNVDCADGYFCDGSVCRANCTGSNCSDPYVDTTTFPYSDGCSLPATCAERGWVCGAIFDGCGYWQNCGTCGAGDTCGAFADGQCGNGDPPGAPSNPAGSCMQILAMAGGNGVSDGLFWVNAGSPGAYYPVQVFCDMTTDGGGWTLVGQVDGMLDMYDNWLRSNVQADNLKTTAIEGNTYSCIDAIDMAVNRSHEVRLSNAARDRWMKWRLPPNRAVASFWHIETGRFTISDLAYNGNEVTELVRWDGYREGCNQNVYGIMPFAEHGGSYPATMINPEGNAYPGDQCLAVGVMKSTTAVYDFTQNGNGFDAPADDYDWPNANTDVPSRVSVWLR